MVQTIKNRTRHDTQVLWELEEDAVRQSLRRRSLVVEEDGEWCLRVPLMARWLRERG